MKITKIGTFDSNGNPIGWGFNMEHEYGAMPFSMYKEGSYCLGLVGPDNSIVTVNGVEIVEWIEARKKAMQS